MTFWRLQSLPVDFRESQGRSPSSAECPKLWEMTLSHTNRHANRAAVIQPSGKWPEREKVVHVILRCLEGKWYPSPPVKHSKASCNLRRKFPIPFVQDTKPDTLSMCFACIWLYIPPLQCNFVPPIACFSVALASIRVRGVEKSKVSSKVSSNISVCPFPPLCSALKWEAQVGVYVVDAEGWRYLWSRYCFGIHGQSKRKP